MDDGAVTCHASTAYGLLLHAFSTIPPWHCLALAAFGSAVFLYNFLEFYFLEDLLSRFKGSCGRGTSPIRLTYNSCCDLYHGVVSRCRIVHGRYVTTPWLSSPHIQTVFLNFFGNPPPVSYRRLFEAEDNWPLAVVHASMQIFHASDGGTIALDWVHSSDDSEGSSRMDKSFCRDDDTPIVVVVPGLTSDSHSPYLKHLAYHTARTGWNVVVSNHRGLGGVSVTSDCFYNAGWTEDIRDVLNFLNHQYPKAPLFAIGTSIGANILVKYLGEDGENVPLAGATAICNPWDLLIGDRFINRKLVQKLYDRALTIGLQGYAQLHEPRYTRLADWEGIKKSRSIRDFDSYATCLVGKFETADTYYRRCSSAAYVGNVAVPLLCISALDDPVCTREAIPWDECRANKNIVLVTPKHGGHLAFFEGITGSSLWWVRAVIEYLHVLHSSKSMHVKKTQASLTHSFPKSSIDQGPYVNVSDGMVAAMGSEQMRGDANEETGTWKPRGKETTKAASDDRVDSARMENSSFLQENIARTPEQQRIGSSSGESSPLVRTLNQLSRATKTSVWLLAYIAIVTSWPWVGSALGSLFRGKIKRGSPASSTRK